jgi:hypothetical protein
VTLVAVLQDGRREALAAVHGDTIADLVASLSGGTLTGSASPLSDAVLELASGDVVQYCAVTTFEETQRFS